MQNLETVSQRKVLEEVRAMMYSRGFSFTPIVVFLVVALLMAVFLGTAIADTDFLNSATNQAKARQIDAETAHQQQLWALELEAQAARWAKELELMERDHQLKARLFEGAAIAGVVIIAPLGFAGAFYIVCAGLALLRQQKQPTLEVVQEGRRAISFPAHRQRARVLANKPATALALLVLGAAVLTVSVSLL